MSPGGGKGGGPMKRYIDGAEKLGCILALSVESRNNFERASDAMDAMVKDVYARITPVHPELSFSSGFSGGSRMAYQLAEENKHIQGVLACGSGSGIYTDDGFRDAKLRRSTYVYSLIGTNCFNRTGAYKSYKEFPKDYRLRYFPGGHAWAPAPLITQGMARTMGEALKNARSRDITPIINSYTQATLQLANELKGKQPWEACWLAVLLADFSTDHPASREANALVHELKNTSQVHIAEKAEEALQDFGKDYFDGVFYKDDQKPNAQRQQDADKIAQQYQGTPYADLIKRLGGKS